MFFGRAGGSGEEEDDDDSSSEDDDSDKCLAGFGVSIAFCGGGLWSGCIGAMPCCLADDCNRSSEFQHQHKLPQKESKHLVSAFLVSSFVEEI